MTISAFFQWFSNWFTDFARGSNDVWNFLFLKIAEINGLVITPISLLSVSAIGVILTIHIIKGVVS